MAELGGDSERTYERVAEHVARVELCESLHERHLGVGGQKVLAGFANVVV
jgi:hypothetical protein